MHRLPYATTKHVVGMRVHARKLARTLSTVPFRGNLIENACNRSLASCYNGCKQWKPHGGYTVGLVDRGQRSRYSSSGPAGCPLTGEDGIVRSPLQQVEIPSDMSVGRYVIDGFEQFGSNIALVDGVTNRKLSYTELHDSIVRVASALSRLGLAKDDVITIIAPNSIEWCIMYLAASMTGAIVSAVNPLYTAGELAHAVDHSESKYIITINELSAVAKEARKICPKVKEIIVFNESDGCRPFSKLLGDDGLQFPENTPVSGGDTVALPYSSGTTGVPKGVVLTHQNIIANIQQMRSESVLRYKPGDTLLGVLPFFHIYGQVVVFLAGLRAGATVIILPRFDPELYLHAAYNYKANYLHVVPPIVLFLAKHPLVAKFDLSFVDTLFVGAAPCGAEMIEESLRKVNKKAVFRQGYGLTEASPVTHCNLKDPSLIRYHTIGPAVPNTDYKIVDVESGVVLGQGQEGELCVRGPQVMKGYYKNQEATDKTLVNGFLHTGDIGYYDESGNVIITDRLKELIKYKGYQVAPAELEALLVTHPDIQDAAVIGKPDEKAGELPRAYVVMETNKTMSAEDVHHFVKGKVAAFKELSGGVQFMSEIPKSAAGKILRRVLKEDLMKK